MKIDPIKVTGLYEANVKKNLTNDGSNVKKGIQSSKDKVEISDTGSKYSEISSLKSKVVNEIGKGASAEKIHKLKTAVENGTYHVSGSDIADAMLNRVKPD